MSKRNIHFDLLELFSDEEIYIVCNNADLNIFLTAIKEKKYEKYSKKLGRLDKKSALVQKFLPKIAYDLYKKNEEPFRVAIAVVLHDYKEKFMLTITEYMEPSVDIEAIQNYTCDQLVTFFFDFQGVSTSEIPEDLFFILLKLYGINYPSEEKKAIVESISQQREEQLKEARHKAEIEDAIKKFAKEKAAEYKEIQDELKRQIKYYKEKYDECLVEKCSVQRALDSLKAQMKYDRREMEAEWKDSYEKQLEQRMASEEEEFRARRVEAENLYLELHRRLEVDAESRKRELDTQYQLDLEEMKRKLNEKKEVLRIEVQALSDKRETIASEIDELIERKGGLELEFSKLKNAEDSYFATFEQRIVEKKIERVLFDKLGISDSRGDTVLHMPKGYSIIEASGFTCGTEYGENVECIEDFIEDCKDNINIHFDNETEIVATVISALVQRMAIIAVNPVCDYLAEAFSALLDVGMPAIVNIDYEKNDSLTLATKINKLDSKVILIKGVLDMYDEILFRRLCELCTEKYMFFSISSLKNVRMMSRIVTDMAVIIDAEEDLHFVTEDNILLGDHNLDLFIPKISNKNCQDLMKKIFNRLVSNSLMGKATAMKYCSVLEMYFKIINTDRIGKILQKAIAISCGVNQNVSDDIKEILSKSGILFLNE